MFGIMTGASLALVGVLLLFMNSQVQAGTLKRNHVYGIRTRQTLLSDEGWDAGHRAAACSLSTGAYRSSKA